MPTLSELYQRRAELEKLSDYHRVLLGDAIQDSAHTLKIIETLTFALTNPVTTKLAASAFLRQTLPSILKKSFPALLPLWNTARGAVSILNLAARLVGSTLSVVSLVIKTIGSLLRNAKDRGASSQARG